MENNQEEYLFAEAVSTKEMNVLTNGAVRIMQGFRLNIGEKSPPRDIAEFNNREKLIKQNEAEIKPGREKLLLIIEAGLEPEVKEALQKAAQIIGENNVEVFVISDSTGPAQPMPEAINEKLRTADAVFIATTKFSRTYSPGMQSLLSPQAQENKLADVWGAMEDKEYNGLSRNQKYPYLASTKPVNWRQRIIREDSHPFEGSPSKSRFITVAGLTKEGLRRAVETDTPEKVARRADEILSVFEGVDEIKIITGNENTLTFKLEPILKGVRDDGQVQYQGQGGNYPYGEVFYSPDWKSVNGSIVIDGPVGGIGKIDGPIRLTFKDGKVEKIEGGDSAKKLRDTLSQFESSFPDGGKVSSAFVLGEFGIGLNNGILPYQNGSIRNDITASEGEKTFGTLHVALGKNPHWGSDTGNTVNYHCDLIVMRPNLVIHKNGEWVELIKEGVHTLIK